MSRAVVSPEAAQDIRLIVEFISRDNATAADRILDDIDAAVESLASMPGMGHVRPDLTRRRVLFWNVRGRYLVIYRERPDHIEIVRVLDGRRDVAAILG